MLLGLNRGLVDKGDDAGSLGFQRVSNTCRPRGIPEHTQSDVGLLHHNAVVC
jgi:hypothetical protein